MSAERPNQVRYPEAAVLEVMSAPSRTEALEIGKRHGLGRNAVDVYFYRTLPRALRLAREAGLPPAPHRRSADSRFIASVMAGDA